MRQIYEGKHAVFQRSRTKVTKFTKAFVTLRVRCVMSSGGSAAKNATEKFGCCTFSAALLREHVRRFTETNLRERGRFGFLVLRLKTKHAPRFYLT